MGIKRYASLESFDHAVAMMTSSNNVSYVKHEKLGVNLCFKLLLNVYLLPKNILCLQVDIHVIYYSCKSVNCKSHWDT